MIGAAYSKTLKTTGTVVVAFYVAVMVLAVACSFGDSAGGHEHHHHSDQSAHSALCLWACQANIGVALLSGPDDGHPTLVAYELALPLSSTPTFESFGLLYLRGPPLG